MKWITKASFLMLCTQKQKKPRHISKSFVCYAPDSELRHIKLLWTTNTWQRRTSEKNASVTQWQVFLGNNSPEDTFITNQMPPSAVK